MNVYVGNRLPSTYQEVEYIQSSGTQFIDTGYLITPTTEVSIDYQYTNANNQDFAFGVGSDSNTSSGMTFCLYIGTTGGVYYFKAGLSDGTASSTWTNEGPQKDTNRHKFVLNNGHFLTYNSSGTLQQDTTTDATFTRTAEHSFGLFCWWRTDTSAWDGKTAAKLYGCKVKDNGVLKRDFVPCYRKSDNVIGLYDLVNSVFYTNSGTGTFSKGNDVTTLNEIKNAYIGEVYEYSYDFRNKSTTAMENDGWTFILNKSYASFGNDGVYVNVNNGTTMFKREVISSIMPNAKKVTLTFTNKTNFGGSDLRLYRVATSSTRSDVTGSHFQIGNSSSECYVQTNIYGSSTNTAQTQSDYLGKWYTQTCVIDLENLKMTTSNTTGFYKEQTLTQTQANNIKNNSIGYYCGLTNNTSGNYTYLKSINVLIEL